MLAQGTVIYSTIYEFVLVPKVLKWAICRVGKSTASVQTVGIFHTLQHTHDFGFSRYNRNDVAGFCTARCFLLYYTSGWWNQDVHSVPTPPRLLRASYVTAAFQQTNRPQRNSCLQLHIDDFLI